MAKKQHPCSTPKIRLRDRLGTLWLCDCGQLYVVKHVAAYGDSVKVWQRVELEGTDLVT